MRSVLICLTLLLLIGCTSGPRETDANLVDLSKYEVLGLSPVSQISPFRPQRVRLLDEFSFIVEADRDHVFLMVIDDGRLARWMSRERGRIRFWPMLKPIKPNYTEVHFQVSNDGPLKSVGNVLAIYRIAWRGQELDVVDVIRHGEQKLIRRYPDTKKPAQGGL